MSSRGTSIAQSFEFRVGQTPTIVVRNPIGSVITQPATDGQVAIQATKTVTGLLLGGNGLDALEKVTVAAEQTGDTITVTVKHPKHVFGGGKAVSVELVLSVPGGTQLDLQVDAGNIELHGGSGVARASVDAGHVKAEGFTFLRSSQVAVDAGNVNLNAALLEDSTLMVHVDAGNLTIQSAVAAGASLDVTVDAGTAKLYLPHDASLYLDASVDMGSIKISGWNVPMKHEIVSHKARGPMGPNPSGNLRVKVDAGTIVIAPLA